MMKRSIYSSVLFLCMSSNVLAQPMDNLRSTLSERTKQFRTTLQHFKECIMRKSGCTQAEKNTIGTALFAAAYLLIVGLLAWRIKHPSEQKRLKEEILGLVNGDTSFRVNEPPGFRFKRLDDRFALIDDESDTSEKIRMLRELKQDIEEQQLRQKMEE